MLRGFHITTKKRNSRLVPGQQALQPIAESISLKFLREAPLPEDILHLDKNILVQILPDRLRYSETRLKVGSQGWITVPPVLKGIHGISCVAKQTPNSTARTIVI